MVVPVGWISQLIGEFTGWFCRVLKRFTDPSSDKNENSSPDASTPIPPQLHPNTHPPILPEHQSSTEDNQSEQNQKVKGNHPADIPGRRNPKHTESEPEAKEKESSSFRPQLMCRRKAGAWQVIVSGNEECPIKGVRLGDQDLEVINQECPIDSLEGHLVTWSENGDKREVALFNGEPLIFKFSKNWKGTEISQITNGHFIVIAPAEWTRVGDRRDTGGAEPCKDEKFRAHFFSRNKNDSDEEIKGFEGQPPLPVGLSIEWDGERVVDDSGKGILFVGDAPKPKSLPGVEWARVGEERKGGWKGKNFKLKEIKTLAEVLNGREGRFFLRIYNAHGAMLDSEPFRYMSQLKEIRVDGKPYTADTAIAPSLTAGYSPTEICFMGRDGNTLTPKLSSQSPLVTMEGDIIRIPRPHPDADCISCNLGTEAGGVKIELQLPRIWWRLESDGDDAGEWSDKPITMTREKFRTLAREDIRISILSKRCKLVHAGFNDKRDKQYSRKEQDECIQIPLYEFDDRLPTEPESHAPLQFNVEWMGEVTAIIAFDSPPRTEPKQPTRPAEGGSGSREGSSNKSPKLASPPHRRKTKPLSSRLKEKIDDKHIILMKRGVAVWLYDNTDLTYDQIADFVELPRIDIESLANNPPSSPYYNLRGIDPIEKGYLTREEIDRCEKDPDSRL